jgi:hypothetical protein
MSQPIGIVGDIHGNVSALAGLLRVIEGRCKQLVFVGDYVNRGPSSAQVIQMLIDGSATGTKHIHIAGNHDVAFLKCLEGGSLSAFLRIGGAATVRSYIVHPEPDVLGQLRQAVPEDHVNFLRALKAHHQEADLLVTHRPNNVGIDAGKTGVGKFHVFGHVPQHKLVPRITEVSAAIDTGCGTLPNGRLTCLVWPTLEVVQVDSNGAMISSAQFYLKEA